MNRTLVSQLGCGILMTALDRVSGNSVLSEICSYGGTMQVSVVESAEHFDATAHSEEWPVIMFKEGLYFLSVKIIYIQSVICYLLKCLSERDHDS